MKPRDIIKRDYPEVQRYIDSIKSIQELYPNYYSEEKLYVKLDRFLDDHYSDLLDPDFDLLLWDRKLRKAILDDLSTLVSTCDKCKLCENRLPNNITPKSVFGEVVVDAPVMLLFEGPGNLENRIQLPLTGNIELRSSDCSLYCKNYEQCFLEKDGNLVLYPKSKCQFDEIDVFDEDSHYALLRKRLARPKNVLNSSGEILDDALSDCDLVRQSSHNLASWIKRVDPDKQVPELIGPNISIVNAVRCRSTDFTLGADQPGGNLTPTQEYITACNPWLDMTIRLVKPKAILALGTPALKALGPLEKLDSITKLCPNSLNIDPLVIKTKLHDKVVVGVHIAYMMREVNTKERDLWYQKLRQLLNKAKEISCQIQVSDLPAQTSLLKIQE
jgi:uracil-DNA glycosylase family 4